MERTHRGRQATNPGRRSARARERRLPRGLLVALREAGVDVERVATRAGLDPRALNEFVRSDESGAFLREALAQVPPWFGLSAGAEVRPELWGVVGLAAMSSASFGAALARVARYKRLMSSDELLIDDRGDEVAVCFRLGNAAAPYARQQLDSELAFLVSLGRRLSGAPLQPLRIAIELSRPSYHERYRALFACPLAFEQPATELVFRARDLARPLLSADAELAEEFSARAARLMPAECTLAVAEQVRLALRGALRGEVPSLAEIARRMHLSERTLQRQLRGNGTSFTRLVDEVRQELARRYLGGDELHAAEVSYLLGFAHPNSFFRAFKRWTGLTPEEYRESH